MTPNARPGRPERQSRRPPFQAKPRVEEKTLKSAKLTIERKTFIFTLKENPRGCFVRITEDVGGRRDTIIVPATGLAEVKRVLEELIEAASQAAATPAPAPAEAPLACTPPPAPEPAAAANPAPLPEAAPGGWQASGPQNQGMGEGPP